MFGIEKIRFTFSFNPWLFLLFVTILAAYTFYAYRQTVPVLNLSQKALLGLLRAFSLTLIVFIIFEPAATFSKKEINKPAALVFIDNSKSILIDDGTDKKGAVFNFAKKLKDTDAINFARLYTFGSNVSPITYDSAFNLSFNEGATNFQKLFELVNEDESNKSSIVIISDGIMTDGINPIHSAESEGIPIFTISVGDTSSRIDIEVKDVIHNELIYAETPTTIMAAVLNRGFEGRDVEVTLYEENKVIANQKINLSSSGIQNVSFTYTPKDGGEKKLAITVSNQPGEFSTQNNKKLFFMNVLSGKEKILLLAGEISPDLSFVKNALESDKNLTVLSISQINKEKFLEAGNYDEMIDSADIYFLIGFPSTNTPVDIYNKIIQKITINGKPFFLLIGAGTDFEKLKKVQGELPFTVGRISQDYSEVQPSLIVSEIKNPIIQNNSNNIISAWNNLPPTVKSNTELNEKPESQVISRVRINNVPFSQPLILTRRLGSKKSIAVLTKDIWRWKLQISDRGSDLFDRFILNSVKWLTSREEVKQVSIKTSKKIYSTGEDVEFSAQVYDEAFNPVSDAELNIIIDGSGQKSIVNLSSLGSGLYEGNFQAVSKGDYSYSGNAKQLNKILGTDAGRFNVGEVEKEELDVKTDAEFLRSLSFVSGGKSFSYKDYDKLFDILIQRNNMTSSEKIKTSEIRFWSNEWLMLLVILLLGVEWFLRKRFGML